MVRTKSVEFMPFPLSFFLTLSAIMWFAYGFLKADLCVSVSDFPLKTILVIESKKLLVHGLDLCFSLKFLDLCFFFF